MSEAGPVKILVVDHMAYYRRAVVDVFADLPEIEVIGLASSWYEALDMVAEQAPDVITLDVNLPDLDRSTMLQDLRSRHDGVRPVLLSADPVSINAGPGITPAAVVFKPAGAGREDCLADFASDLLARVLMVPTDE